MESQKILNSDYLDILFDGRNKKYGGYELRKNYSRRLGKAMALLVGCAIITSSYAFVGKTKPLDDIITCDFPLIPTNLTPPPLNPEIPSAPPPPPPPPPPAARLTIQHTEPIIQDDDDVPDDDRMHRQDELRNVAMGAATQDGDSMDIGPAIIQHPSTGTGIVTPPAPTTFTYVEQMPAPTYNINAYLGANLRYPQMAKDNNIEGKVIIKFVVDEKGEIGDVKVDGKRRYGGGLEEEAIRVVQSMPKWMAGKQNGIPVRVYFILPINFELN